ncbi:MAG: alanine dehydrogenase [Bacteroidales bacterium]|nr:alanine dehydrogenase [Bacteroidales bacterium]
MTAKCSLIPREKAKETFNGKKQLCISVLKEDPEKETRVALTPMGVSNLSESGHKIFVEQGAGSAANYSDMEYVKSGATVTADKEKIFSSDIILKVSPFTTEETLFVKKEQTLISHLSVARAEKQAIENILKKKAVALALEYIRTEKDFYPVNFINSEIAGRTSVFTGAEYLSRQSGGKGVLLGGITGISPASVVIIGTGTAALYATKTALSIGAEVKVFDTSLSQLSLFTQKLGHEIFTSVLQPQILNKALASADLVIGAKCIKSPTFSFITQENIAMMKKGSVIVDLNIETGSCFETSKPMTLKNPSFECCGVIHYCLPDIATLVPRTASIALSNVIYPLINDIHNNGGIYPKISYDKFIRQSVYCYNGLLTNDYLGKKFNIKSKDIDLYLI